MTDVLILTVEVGLCPVMMGWGVLPVQCVRASFLLGDRGRRLVCISSMLWSLPALEPIAGEWESCFVWVFFFESMPQLR